MPAIDDRRRLLSALALALVLAAAAGHLAVSQSETLPAVVIVLLGGSLVGGILPHRWWLGAIVGLGVPATALGTRPPPEVIANLATWIAPAVALAAAGLGVTLARHLREP